MVVAICICNMAQMVHTTVGTIGSANAQWLVGNHTKLLLSAIKELLYL